MGKAPKMCPMCRSMMKWKKIDTTKKGVSAGKAVAGAAVGALISGPFAPIGAIAGAAMGKKKVTYACKNCGFQHEYDK